MVKMDLQARKIEFVQKFLKLMSEKAITKLDNLLIQEQRKQLKEDFQPKTLELLNEEVDLALRDSANDNVIDSDTLLEKYQEWD